MFVLILGIYRCKFAVPTIEKNILHEKLTIPSDSTNVCEIVNRLGLNDKIDLCQQLHLCVPGVYPLIFNFRSFTQKKKEIAVEDPYSILLQYLAVRPQIILPKNILVHDTRLDKDIFLGIADLKPSERDLARFKLVCVERPSVYIIVRKDPRNQHYMEISKLEQVCWYGEPTNGKHFQNAKRDEGQPYDQTSEPLADCLSQEVPSGNPIGATQHGLQTQNHASTADELSCEASNRTQAQLSKDFESRTPDKDQADQEQPEEHSPEAAERSQAQHNHTENQSKDPIEEQQHQNQTQSTSISSENNIAALVQNENIHISAIEVGI